MFGNCSDVEIQTIKRIKILNDISGEVVLTFMILSEGMTEDMKNKYKTLVKDIDSLIKDETSLLESMQAHHNHDDEQFFKSDLSDVFEDIRNEQKKRYESNTSNWFIRQGNG